MVTGTETGRFIDTAKQYHWIEEGSDEDFRQNVLACDPLHYYMSATSGTCDPHVYGVYTGRMAVRQVQRAPDVVPGAPMWRALQGAVNIYGDLGAVERTLLQMLLERPEMAGSEIMAALPVRQAQPWLR